MCGRNHHRPALYKTLFVYDATWSGFLGKFAYRVVSGKEGRKEMTDWGGEEGRGVVEGCLP